MNLEPQNREIDEIEGFQESRPPEERLAKSDDHVDNLDFWQKMDKISTSFRKRKSGREDSYVGRHQKEVEVFWVSEIS